MCSHPEPPKAKHWTDYSSFFVSVLALLTSFATFSATFLNTADLQFSKPKVIGFFEDVCRSFVEAGKDKGPYIVSYVAMNFGNVGGVQSRALLFPNIISIKFPNKIIEHKFFFTSNSETSLEFKNPEIPKSSKCVEKNGRTHYVESTKGISLGPRDYEGTFMLKSGDFKYTEFFFAPRDGIQFINKQDFIDLLKSDGSAILEVDLQVAYRTDVGWLSRRSSATIKCQIVISSSTLSYFRETGHIGIPPTGECVSEELKVLL
ncbi:MAG TPA: hypothetical protein VF601_05270 [Beijerinckiaceae bacterium]|jgi:hypothetical protein